MGQYQEDNKEKSCSKNYLLKFHLQEPIYVHFSNPSFFSNEDMVVFCILKNKGLLLPPNLLDKF
ncbi:hypothetical protein A3863_06530 [Priestia endophytica]|uniref:Uncharacterized protein n=1 Tax=Priestia endophytica TaxID=135735 RepID=A0AAX1Q7A4_9BACI|nr:hypothetical protein A3864_15765 [Priestia endophytica]RAS91218.1 hypothetical protein A3863_06530 [Priestia endophytica]